MKNNMYFSLLFLVIYSCSTTDKELCIPASTQNLQIDYIIDYTPGQLYIEMDNLYDSIKVEGKSLIDVKNYTKIRRFLFDAAALGNPSNHSFKSYLPTFGGLSSEKFELEVKFDIDSIVSSKNISDKLDVSNQILFLKTDATEIWEDKCVRKNRLRSLNNLYDNYSKKYLCHTNIQMTMIVGSKKAQKRFTRSNVVIYSTGELSDFPDSPNM